MVIVCVFTAKVGCLGLRVSSCLVLSQHSSENSTNSHNGYNQDNSIINTVLIIITTIIRLHRSTTYVDAVYCYRLSSVVCQSVGLSVTFVIPAKTAEPIKIPFGLRTSVGPGNHC